jgi:hypothetical protein
VVAGCGFFDVEKDDLGDGKIKVNIPILGG